jgi:hypothetical protein
MPTVFVVFTSAEAGAAALFSDQCPGRYAWAMKPKFQSGRLLATPGALRALESAGQNTADFLERHLNCDWGNLDGNDFRENEYSLEHRFRLSAGFYLDRLFLIFYFSFCF